MENEQERRYLMKRLNLLSKLNLLQRSSPKMILMKMMKVLAGRRTDRDMFDVLTEMREWKGICITRVNLEKVKN